MSLRHFYYIYTLIQRLACMLKKESCLLNSNIKFRTEESIILRLDSVKSAVRTGWRLANRSFNDLAED